MKVRRRTGEETEAALALRDNLVLRFATHVALHVRILFTSPLVQLCNYHGDKAEAHDHVATGDSPAGVQDSVRR